VLPREIAERLKGRPDSIAERFPHASVLFSDLVDFTPLTTSMPPDEMVALLNQLFSAFDQLAERRGVEKIKTIGDGYEVVAGVPVPVADPDGAIAEMALDMQAAVADLRSVTGRDLRIRIGVASGPVVAGVIGKKKFVYEVWGDAVNTASRMESHGLPDSIQVTEETYRILRDRYQFADRGTIDVKGKGAMRTYLLTGRRARPGA
jgi:adenylate cyclase